MRSTSTTIILLCMCFLAMPAQGQGKFQVAPYLQYGTKTSMVILWETHSPATTRVEYGESRFGDASPNLEHSLELPGQRTMHEVVLNDLKPETKYFWRVVSESADGALLESEPSTFRTTVNDSTAFAFLLYGDSQSNPEVWGKLARLGWEERPNFALHAGDLVDRGGNLDDWLVEFFPPAHDLMQRVPLYTALGNHEDDHAHYYKYMHNPPPEYHYTFTYGNAQFFIVDTNRPVHEGSEQYAWLEQELAKSTAAWKFAVHHHPPYSSEENDHGDSWTGSTSYGTHSRNLVPLYEHYGVDFCLFGHVHMYERTWPLMKDKVNQKNGVIYINSGGAGGGLEAFAPTRSWFTAKARSVHHYGYFMIHDNTVHFQAIDEEGRVFDTLQLTKEGERWTQSQVIKPPPPVLRHNGPAFTDTLHITLNTNFEDLMLRYTVDGQPPSTDSPAYTSAVVIDKSTTFKAASFTNDGRRSRVITYAFEQIAYEAAIKPGKLKPGMSFAYYEGAWNRVPDVDGIPPVLTGTAATISLEGTAQREENYALFFDGYISIPEDDVYTFYTDSDDGSKLFINNNLVVDNDGLHGSQVRSGQIALKAGYHHLRLSFMQRGGGYKLEAGGLGKKTQKNVLTPDNLFHKE